MKNEFLHNSNVGLLLIRLGLAAVFINSGFAKFMNLTGTMKFFDSVGLSSPFVYLVAGVELLGGIAMLLGVGTRVVGWLLALDMLFAIYLVKFAMGFAGGGYRLDLLLLLVSLGIAFAGPGKYAICGGRCDVGKRASE